LNSSPGIRRANAEMCNLHSMTTNVEALRRLFRVDASRDHLGLPALPGIFPAVTLYPTRSSSDENFSVPTSALRTNRSRLSGFVGNGADLRSFAGVRGVDHSVALAVENHPPGTIRREALEGGVPTHGSDDLLQDLDIKSRRLVIAYVLQGTQSNITDELQRFRRRRTSAHRPKIGSMIRKTSVVSIEPMGRSRMVLQ